MKGKDYFKLLVSIILPLLAGFIGSIFTSSSISNWYITIKKPFFNPPNWVFGPVWTMLYILMGVSFYLFWQKGSNRKEVKDGMSIFTIQLILNVAWSIIFFSLKSIFFSFIEILILWFFVLLTIRMFYKVSKPSAYLLIPYMLWISFAAILNFSIFILNL